ncbi:hypothetical protein EDD57_1105 [Baia soyae]|uniref:Uncharacterized protein n=1 Tax=Baia soyae TaxID=1544746 RepID=A0A4R2RXM3_9BACL|nr:hypothetical protein EDD57_1105 [Baia soyae]
MDFNGCKGRESCEKGLRGFFDLGHVLDVSQCMAIQDLLEIQSGKISLEEFKEKWSEYVTDDRKSERSLW